MESRSMSTTLTARVGLAVSAIVMLSAHDRLSAYGLASDSIRAARAGRCGDGKTRDAEQTKGAERRVSLAEIGTLRVPSCDIWCVSHDGKSLLYARQGTTANGEYISNIRITPVHARRDTPTLFTVPNITRWLAWSPSGDRILVCTDKATFLAERSGAGHTWRLHRLSSRWGRGCFSADKSFCVGIRTPDMDGDFDTELLR